MARRGRPVRYHSNASRLEGAWLDRRKTAHRCFLHMQLPSHRVAELGFDFVIAVSPEPGPSYRDLYQTSLIPSEWKGARILFIQPAFDLKEIGVDYLSAQGDGLQRAFEVGREAEFALADREVPEESA